MTEREIWERAFNAALTGALAGAIGGTVQGSVNVADAAADSALAIHKERWPSRGGGTGYGDKPPAVVVGSISGVLAGAVVALQEAGRHDAHKVLNSLLEAYKAGTSSSWTPPPRG